MQEIWKPVVGYEGIYEVSNIGRVKSLPRRYSKSKHEIFLKPSTSNGYDYFCLTKDRIEKRIQAHKIVAQAFIPNPHNKRCVNHIDGNKSNNTTTNLEWNTYSENMSHAIRMGLKISKKGSKSSGAKLNEKEIIEIQDLLKCGLFTQADIGHFYNVSFQTISMIKLNKIWSHVDRESIPRGTNKIHMLGQLNPSSKLTNKHVLEIKILLKNGNINKKQIAEIYNVSIHTIDNIHSNRNWTHIK